MIPQESVPEGQLLSFSLKTTALAFEEFYLRDNAILEGGQGVFASLFKGRHFTLGGLQLAVPAGQVEVGSFHLLEGKKGLAAVERRCLVGRGTAYIHRGETPGIIDGNVKPGTDGGRPLAETGEEGGAFAACSCAESKGRQKVQAGRFLKLKGRAHPGFRCQKIRASGHDRGGGAHGQGGRADGSEVTGGAGQGASSAEGLELQVREATQAVKIEKATGETFVFGFLSEQFGIGEQAGLPSLPQDFHDFPVGRNGIGDQGTLFVKAQDAEVSVGHPGGHEQAAGMEIPEGGLLCFQGGSRAGVEPSKEVKLP